MAKRKYGTFFKSIEAFFFMLLGGLFMMILVVAFNKPVKKKEEKVKKETRYVKMEKKAVKKASKPKPKPKPKAKKAPPKAPLPNLGSALGGIEMNIPEFDTGDIGADATELLDKVDEDTVMDGNTVDVKPRVVSRSKIEYPPAAMRKQIKGYVIVNVLIDKQGNIETAQVLEAFPSGVFDAVALEGVKSWRFSPAKYKGQPVKVWAKQKVRFDFN
ncbi:MAG TPA: energy transducer TonB [Campylobacterales bacterium]|nr:energy transducer TonB [Campylobacterales bacterium]HHD80100.1 energy transducer TonB [Campylobacterales bacterium]HHH50861.1 energy transducer TonB [Campylobacterales bacterium]